MGKNIRVKKEPGTTLNGTSSASWSVGRNLDERIYLKAAQKNFEPYLVFDPSTQAWYAVASLEEEEALNRGELGQLGGLMKDTLTIGGRVFTDLKDLFIITAGQTWGDHSIVGHHAIGSGLGPNVPWSVPAGKKLLVFAGLGITNGAIGYADFLPRLNTIDPAELAAQNPVYADSIGTYNQAPTGDPEVLQEQRPLQSYAQDGGVIFAPNFEIPAGKFPFAQGVNGVLYCKLVSA